jgi:hypothetical protein
MTASEVDLFGLTQDLYVKKIEEIYQDWQDGNVQSDEALKQFCLLIGPIQDHQKMIEALDKLVRAKTGEVLAFIGETVEIKGFGKLEITRPSVSYSYDRKLLDQLTNQLRTEGLGDVATRLDTCLKPSERAGTLRITREKP